MQKVMQNQIKWQIVTLFFLLVFGLSAQDPALLKDINVAVGNSSPRNMTTVGNIVFFSADDPVHGYELWKTDGTIAGTVLVKDICTGSIASNPANLFNVNGTLFFSANDGFRGIELWKSDGTADGTVLVKDINPGAADSAPRGLFRVGGVLFFVANDGTHGFEMWKCPLAEIGIEMVKDINPGGADSNPSSFVLNGPAVFFAATVTTNGVADRELWKSHGNEFGTQMVKNINLNGSSEPSEIVRFNNKIFFAAEVTINGVTDRELWSSTGDTLGTQLVKNINAPFSSMPTALTVFNGALFFVASSPNLGRELYKSNGTPEGTTNEPTFDLVSGAVSSTPLHLTVVNGMLFFSATTTATGRELWKLTNGNVASMVKNINPLNASSTPQALIAVGTTLFFTAKTGTHGRELWKSDGTELGTALVQDFVVGQTGSNISETDMAVRGSDLFFFSDGADGRELRRATTASISTVRNIGQGHSNPADFVKMGNLTFFSADNGLNGRELWRTDGTELGTFMLKDITVGSIGSNPTELTVVTNGNVSTLFFVAGGSRQIFKSNGTLAGTIPVQTFFLGGIGQNPTNLTAFQGKLFFVATNSFPNGAPDEKRLFKTDGTINVVDQVDNIALDPQNLTPVGTNLFFTATKNNTDRELWKTTINSIAQRVKNINAASSSNPTELIGIGNKLFFTANNGNGSQVWKSDGVADGAGTQPIAGSFGAHELTNFNNRLVVLSNSSNIPGMKNLLRMNAALTGFDSLTRGFIQILQAAGTNLYIFESHAGPLFLSKMNTQGQVVDLGELPESNAMGFQIISAGAKIFFAYPMTDFGTEMWQSDGTVDGTRLVFNIWPGVGSANVNEMALCGSDIFFSANNITNGQEPWKLANVVLFDGGGGGERASNDYMDEQQIVLPLSIAPEIKAYPNPATDFIRIDLPDHEAVSGMLSLMDVSGRSLREAQSKAGETSIQFEISDLPKGVYIIRWTQSDGQIATQKVVVQ